MIYCDFLLNVLATLGDDRPGHEFTRYSVNYLTRAVNQGLILAAKSRPDLFTETAIIKLRTGSFQDVRGTFDELFEVLAQTDEAGNILRPIDGSRPTANTAKSNWMKASCLVDHCDVGYVVSSANIEVLTAGKFSVMPPVPPGIDAYILVRGMSNPKTLTEEDLPHDLQWNDLLYAVIPYYIFATVAITEHDDAAHQRYLATFYQMLQRAFDVKVDIQSSEKPDDVTPRSNNRA